MLKKVQKHHTLQKKKYLCRQKYIMNFTRLTQKITIAFLVAITFVSCSKDGKEDDTTPLSREEAKQFIEQTTDNFYNCLKDLNDGGFSNFFYESFFTIAETVTTTHTYGNPPYEYVYTQVENHSWMSILSDAFEDQYGDVFDDSFNYQLMKGVYTWDNTSKKWKKSNGNNITLHFPSKKDATTNNATLILDGYTDQTFTIEGKEVKLPKRGNISVTVDSSKIFSIKVNDVAYMQTGESIMIEKADIEAYANPFTANLKWNKTSENIFRLDFVFSSPNACSTSLKGEVKLTHTDIENINPESDIEKITLEISHNELIIRSLADLKGLYGSKKNIDDMSAEEINSFIKSEVFKNSKKIADLKLEKDNTEKLIPYLIFEDGSKEKAENFVSDFPERVEKIFKRFFEGRK